MSREPFIVSEDKSLEVTFREVRDFEEYKDLTFETDPSTSNVEDQKESNDLDTSESTEESTELNPGDTWEDQFFVDEPYFGSSFEVKEEEPEEEADEDADDSEETPDFNENAETIQHKNEEDSETEEPATAEEWVASDLSADDSDETSVNETVIDEEVAADPVAAEKEFADEDSASEEEVEEAEEAEQESSDEDDSAEKEESPVATEPFGSFIVEAGEESHPVTVEAEPAWEDDAWDDNNDSDESDDDKESEGSFSEELSQANVTELILGQVRDVETYSLEESDEDENDAGEESREVDTFDAITTEHESLNKADTVEELEPEYSDLGQPDTIALEEGELPNFEGIPQLSTPSDDSAEEAEELELDLSDED